MLQVGTVVVPDPVSAVCSYRLLLQCALHAAGLQPLMPPVCLL